MPRTVFLAWLMGCPTEQLEDLITPLDQGVARPVQTQDTTYVFDADALRKPAWIGVDLSIIRKMPQPGPYAQQKCRQ